LKLKRSSRKQKGIAERKTETRRKTEISYRAVGLGLLLWLFVTWLFFGRGIDRHIDIAEGQPFPSTIAASVDFECENLSATSLNQTKAAESVPLVFNIDPEPQEHAVEVVSKLFDRLRKLPAASSNQYQIIENSIDDLLIGSSVDTEELVAAFPEKSILPSKNTLITNLMTVMSSGILSDESRRTLFRDTTDSRLTITGDNQPARTVSQQDIYSVRQACRAISADIKDTRQRELAERLLSSLIEGNIDYDEEATEALRESAMQQVEPVIEQHLSGSPIVRAGDPATEQTLLMLKRHEQTRREQQEVFDQLLEILGNGILLLAGLIATTVILRIVAPALLARPDQLLLLVILSLFTLSIARLLTYLSVQYALIASELLMYLVPHALAIMLAGILLGGNAAICLGLWTSFATAVLFNQSFNVFALGLLITRLSPRSSQACCPPY
jgi:membrane-associated HD superfamily phosphohydrolase